MRAIEQISEQFSVLQSNFVEFAEDARQLAEDYGSVFLYPYSKAPLLTNLSRFSRLNFP